MKKQRKLNLRKLSIAKLDAALFVKGGTDSEDTNWTGPKTRTKVTQIPEECIILSELIGVC
ncbi:hypothetical protein [Kordia sp.]|uniref:hypothetical protein n=1 Tax=Kordia sp. TaxID=1965332 RepID=UPI003D6C665D